MPTKTKSAKVSDRQKIENLTNCIHMMQDRLDEKDRIIQADAEYIEEQNRLIREQRELIDAYRMKADGYRLKFEALQMKIETNHSAATGATDAPAQEHGRHKRHLWQTRRRRPGRE